MPSSSGRIREARAAARPHILVFAYACEPGRGSEPGAGWGLVRALATFADCTVLLGPEHVPAIRRWEAEQRDAGLEFVEVPEPWWAHREPRHRLTRFAVYIAWLRRAHAVGLLLHRRTRFDAVYHATYSVYWLPSPAVDYDVPCIWGPVGGAVITPRGLRSLLGWRGLLSELLDFSAVRALAALPATRRTSRRAAVVLVQNEATLERLPQHVRSRAIVLNHALFTEMPLLPAGRRERHLLFVGSLESRKGARLAVHALTFAHRDVELRIVGDGSEHSALRYLAQRLGVSSRLTFLGRATREEALRLMAGAAAVIFTGLREEGGITLAEAMLLGTPVIVLAHGGARTIAASGCDASRVSLIAPADVPTTGRRLGEAMSRFSQETPARHDPMLAGAEALRKLRAAVAGVCRCGSWDPTETERPL